MISSNLKKKILIVFGTRPEAIKMAPLIHEFKKHPDVFETVVCVTGQHRQMLDQILMMFKIYPEYDLHTMKRNQDLFGITTGVISGLKEILIKESPFMVFVQGDTTSSFVAALSAFYLQIPVAHVEAGLRTFDTSNPWPEEMNRSLISRIASWHFAPTMETKQNLLLENIKEDRIVITGNTSIDALQIIINQLKDHNEIESDLINSISQEGYCSSRLDSKRKLILVTSHRRENISNGLQNICQAVHNLAHLHSDIDFVYPVHLNPNVREQVYRILGDNSNNENIFLINPLSYLPFIYLMSKAYLILTDSGGIQEEAPALGIPVLVMRDTTERPEAIEAGTAKLVGTDKNLIEQTVSDLLNNPVLYETMSFRSNPFGDGKAAERIVSFISNLE